MTFKLEYASTIVIHVDERLIFDVHDDWVLVHPYFFDEQLYKKMCGYSLVEFFIALKKKVDEKNSEYNELSFFEWLMAF